MSSVPAAVSYRDDILETLIDRFLSKLEKSLEEGREADISDDAFNQLRSQVWKVIFIYY